MNAGRLEHLAIDRFLLQEFAIAEPLAEKFEGESADLRVLHQRLHGVDRLQGGVEVHRVVDLEDGLADLVTARTLLAQLQ